MIDPVRRAQRSHAELAAGTELMLGLLSVDTRPKTRDLKTPWRSALSKCWVDSRVKIANGQYSTYIHGNGIGRRTIVYYYWSLESGEVWNGLRTGNMGDGVFVFFILWSTDRIWSWSCIIPHYRLLVSRKYPLEIYRNHHLANMAIPYTLFSVICLASHGFEILGGKL